MQSEMTPEARVAKIAEIRAALEHCKILSVGLNIGDTEWLLNELSAETKRADDAEAVSLHFAAGDLDSSKVAREKINKLQRELRIVECDKKAYYGAINNAIEVLSHKFFALQPTGDLPSENSAGGQLAQCVESIFSAYETERDKLQGELEQSKHVAETQRVALELVGNKRGSDGFGSTDLKAERDRLAGEVERLKLETGRAVNLAVALTEQRQLAEHAALLGKLREGLQAKLEETEDLQLGMGDEDNRVKIRRSKINIIEVLALIDSLTPAPKPEESGCDLKEAGGGCEPAYENHPSQKTS